MQVDEQTSAIKSSSETKTISLVARNEDGFQDVKAFPKQHKKLKKKTNPAETISKIAVKAGHEMENQIKKLRNDGFEKILNGVASEISNLMHDRKFIVDKSTKTDSVEIKTQKNASDSLSKIEKQLPEIISVSVPCIQQAKQYLDAHTPNIQPTLPDLPSVNDAKLYLETLISNPPQKVKTNVGTQTSGIFDSLDISSIHASLSKAEAHMKHGGRIESHVGESATSNLSKSRKGAGIYRTLEFIRDLKARKEAGIAKRKAELEAAPAPIVAPEKPAWMKNLNSRNKISKKRRGGLK